MGPKGRKPTLGGLSEAFQAGSDRVPQGRNGQLRPHFEVGGAAVSEGVAGSQSRHEVPGNTLPTRAVMSRPFFNPVRTIFKSVVPHKKMVRKLPQNHFQNFKNGIEPAVHLSTPEIPGKPPEIPGKPPEIPGKPPEIPGTS